MMMILLLLPLLLLLLLLDLQWRRLGKKWRLYPGLPLILTPVDQVRQQYQRQ
jgi:hypothetical protein